jgi:UDP-N-acetylmuramyl pentapeptide phosphotransferase/UDP-N-acetylglucosamine-1-phosphate transferase
MSIFIVLATATIVSAAGTGLMRSYALANRVLDVPNLRSSHVMPTPRGGGVGVVAALFLAFALVYFVFRAATVVLLLPLVGMFIVAAIGWRDDRVGVSVPGRLSAHALGALTLLPVVLMPAPIPTWMGWFSAVWWVFWGISSINVVNFIDGIDGLIASQALLFGIHLTALAGAAGTAGFFGATMAGAALGFLLWNWAPAKIFLGDVGSGALGFAFVFGGALVMRQRGVGLVAIFLPLLPIFLDALVTLLQRALRGERIWHAHRSHLYQRLANGGWGHSRVSLLYAAAALLGVAIATQHQARGWPMLAVGYLSLLLSGGVWLNRSLPRKSARTDVYYSDIPSHP